MKERIKIILISFYFIILALLNLFSPISVEYIYRYLYLPGIILSSYLWGIAGGVTSSFIAIFTYFPVIKILDEFGVDEKIFEIIISFVLFFIIGWWTGVLFEKEKNNRKYYYFLSELNKRLIQLNEDKIILEFCNLIYNFLNIKNLYLVSDDGKINFAIPEYNNEFPYHQILKTIQSSSEYDIKIFILDDLRSHFLITVPLQKRSLEKKFIFLESNFFSGHHLTDFELKVLSSIINQFILIKEIFNFHTEIDVYVSYIKNIIDNISTGVVVCDEKEIIYANNFYENLVNKNLLPSDFYKNLKDKIRDVKDEPLTYEIKTNSNNIMELKIYPWDFLNKRFIITLNDISKYKMSLVLEKAEKLKSEFITSLSHEMKTPLTSIKGFISTMIKDDRGFFDDNKKTEFLYIVKEETERLSRLLQDLLDVSILEKNKEINIIKEKIDIHQIIEKVIYLIKQTTDIHTFKVFRDERCKFIFSDKDRLKQILFNLVQNAVNYSPQGGEVSIVINKIENNFCKIQVIDQGIGIDDDKIGELFTKGKRFEEKIKGFGFGLYLTKNLVEKLGGEIKVSSVKKFGSCFSFTIPSA